MKSPPPEPPSPMRVLAVVLPDRDEAGCSGAPVLHLHAELDLH